MTFKLLALDQSSITTGYCIYENGKPTTISHFTIKGSSAEERLLKIVKQIKQLIQENQIDHVAFEDIQLSQSTVNNVKTFKILAQVQGAIIVILQDMNIPYTIIPPITWKATIGIAGRGRKMEKAMAQGWVKNTYSTNCTEDEADATCLGYHVITKKSEIDWS